jgi:hypothetical protein
MALVVKDRVQETSTTTGTGTLTLSGAASGYQSFSSAIGNGNTTYYAISNGTDWEVGIGTVGSGTLSRDTVLESSNAGSLVDFSAGVKTVFCTYPAERSVNTEDIGVSIQAYDADTAKYDDATANFTGTLQNGGSNVLVDTDIGSTVEAYDSTILKSASIGVTVQAYDADTAKYDDATANFTGTLQNGGSNVVVDTDIGSTVQAYDADTAKYDDTTANFTGTLQNGGSNVVVDTDIGSTVQAYDADTTKNDVANTFTATNTFTANQIISVTDNTNAALRITQAGTGDALLVEDEANPDSTPFVIKNDGKVGIGVSVPSYPLDITLLEATSRIYSTQAGKGAMRLFSTTTGTMYVGKDYEGSSGWWGSGGEYVIAGTGNYPIDFHTNSVKRMTIGGDGDVIVGGTSQPSGLGATERFRIIGAGAISGGPSAFAQFRFSSTSNAVFQRFYNSRSNTINGHAAVENGQLIYQHVTSGSDGTGWKEMATWNISVDGAVSTGVIPTSMVFQTANFSGEMVNRFGAFSNGNFQFDSGYGSAATAYGCRAWVNFDGTSNATNLTGTYSQTGTTVTVTITAHGYITGNSAFLDFTSGTAVDGAYEVTVTDANTFTVTQASRTTSGNVTDRRSNIRASGNVSSVADTGTGDYIVNFVTAMPDADYSVSGTAQQGGATRVVCPFVSGGGATSEPPTTTNFRVQTRLVGSSPTISDSTYVNVAVFR